MNLYEPIEPHASPAEDGYCALHEYKHDLMHRETGPSRAWIVTGNGPAPATHSAPRADYKFDDGQLHHHTPDDLQLEPGTRLRLDASSRGRHFDGGDHYLTKRRFCVLDGPLAGTCWEAMDSEYLDGVGNHYDRAQPIP